MYLAAAGVGRIGIVDFDVVDESNLQRQIIHGTSQVGVAKVVSAAARIKDINPNVQVDTFQEPLNSDNALQIMAPYDVVVDGTDNFPTRYLINDACVLLGKPNVYGSIFKFEGQASVFNYQGGPNYRDLYPEPPPPGLVPNCAEGGVLGILPAVIGSIQATETLKILLGMGTTLSGRLLLYDAMNMQFRELKLRCDPDGAPITELIDYEQFCGAPMNDHETLDSGHPGAFHRLTVTDAKAKLDSGWKPFVLDVRKRHEADIVKLSFVDRLEPHETVVSIVGELPVAGDILVHCKLGRRSALAIESLIGAGVDASRLYNLEGGITDWAQQVDESLPTY